MQVTAYNETYSCAKAEKGENYVRLYDARGNIIASFDGITSFDAFSLNGDTWKEPINRRISKIEAAFADISALLPSSFRDNLSSAEISQTSTTS